MGGIVAAGHPEIRKNVHGSTQVIDSVGTTCLTCLRWPRGHRAQPDC